MHALDGARHLEALGYSSRLCALVAHHSGARFEAVQRGLTDELDRFSYEQSPVADALTAADLTTRPDGQILTARQRIAEILTRYPPDSPVHRAVTVAQPALIHQVRRAL